VCPFCKGKTLLEGVTTADIESYACLAEGVFNLFEAFDHEMQMAWSWQGRDDEEYHEWEEVFVGFLLGKLKRMVVLGTLCRFHKVEYVRTAWVFWPSISLLYSVVKRIEHV
jgi:hypothetical protein